MVAQSAKNRQIWSHCSSQRTDEKLPKNSFFIPLFFVGVIHCLFIILCLHCVFFNIDAKNVNKCAHKKLTWPDFRISCNKFSHSFYFVFSVACKKLPNVFKSCPKMISLEQLKILTPLQKLLKNVGDLAKIIVAKGFEKLPKVQ